MPPYSRRSKLGGIDGSLILQMKSLVAENVRIKRMYLEVNMQCDLLKDALKKVTRVCDRNDLRAFVWLARLSGFRRPAIAMSDA